ncbi:early nodulin-like protein 4 isoform X2 [Coffea arabica]|uniref:Early nodulin-like protein 4 isoform X2 n=1 Tax=Coffea arabica TaxID=13443 RepID=A0A6P6WMB6_COFAR|nr:early nodulin-like protein 1 isoform X2 [Coffea arabica]
MEFGQRIAFTIFLVTFLGFFLSISQSYTFYVGGREGWVLKPKEDYNQWAGRNRFQINDTLIFRYKKGYDDVLEVDKDDYYNCNKENPFLALKDGESVFKFNRSGPFFFISGYADNCQKGQRLIIVVLHPRAASPPSPVIVQPFAPAPSPSAALTTFGGSIGSLLGISLFLAIFAFGY